MLLVTVIIPTYNRAEYLSQALASVLDQSLPPYEIIVVDDGSKDNTPELVSGFGSRLCYVRHAQNQGVSEARNSGLDAAHGDVIAWLDADDVWERDFLKTVIPVLEADDRVDGVYTGLVRIDADGNLLPQSGQIAPPSPSELRSSLVEACHIQTSTFVAYKACFDRVGRFDPQFDICEDYDMFLRLSETCTLAGLSAPLVRYRVHEHNTLANLAAFCRYRLAVMQKHYGEPKGDPRTWSAEKRRAHGHAFRAAAFKSIEAGQMDQGWDYLSQAASILPSLLGRLDTYYEIACGDQPMGFRGQADLLDIDRNGAEMLARLDALFAASRPSLASMRRPAYGNAYLALAILSEQAGRWTAARKHLFAAVRVNPRLMTSHSLIRRLLKLCMGRRLTEFSRRQFGSQLKAV